MRRTAKPSPVKLSFDCVLVAVAFVVSYLKLSKSVGSENHSTLNKDFKSDLQGLDANHQFNIYRLVATPRHCVLLY